MLYLKKYELFGTRLLKKRGFRFRGRVTGFHVASGLGFMCTQSLQNPLIKEYTSNFYEGSYYNLRYFLIKGFWRVYVLGGATGETGESISGVLPGFGFFRG